MSTRIQLTVNLANQTVLTSTISRPVWSIGRLPDNDLVLPAPEVSQHHAEIRLEGEKVVLTDLESNGTVVNGFRLLPNQPALLSDGAAIEIGPYLINYRSVPIKSEMRWVVVDAQASLSATADIWTRRRVADEEDGGFASQDHCNSYLQYLPIIFHESDFLRRFLQIFESIWEPLEQRQDHFHMYFNPRTCPASFLPWFAGWFDLNVTSHWPESRVRAWLMEAIELYRWRGTKYGLSRMIEVCTGLKPEINEDAADPFVFRIKVRLPADGSIGTDVVEDLIRTQKPAHSGYLLEVQ